MSALNEQVRFEHTHDGQRLAITEVDRGAGHPATSPRSPALLVHGFAQNRLAFTRGPLPSVLLDLGLRVFIGELRGHGRSRPSLAGGTFERHDWGMQDHLRYDLPALMTHVLRHTGAEKLHYMGHSMGGLLGYAALASHPPFASFSGWAAPLRLGAGRPEVSLAAALIPPLVRAGRPRQVPMQHFLGALAAPLSEPEAGLPLRGLQRFLGLGNPRQSQPQDLAAILSQADPESSKVFFELARLSMQRRPKVAGVDIKAAVAGWPGPVAAVVGAHDIFAGPKSVRALDGAQHAGARQIVCVEQGTHVDVTMGHHVPDTIETLRGFLCLDS